LQFPAPEQRHQAIFGLGALFPLAWRETDPSDTSVEALIRDLLDGQYANLVGIVGFNTAEGWSRWSFAPGAPPRAAIFRSASVILSIASKGVG